MVIYSKKGGRKILHFENCRYIKNMKKDNRGYFGTADIGHNAGFRFCKCCSPIGVQLKKERHEVLRDCQRYGISVRQNDGALIVRTQNGEWKITKNSFSDGLLLYRRAEYSGHYTADGCCGAFEYAVQKITSESICGYLRYINQYRIRRVSSKADRVPAPTRSA